MPRTFLVFGVGARRLLAVGRESMTVGKVLNKRVEYIQRVWHINPLSHSYTTKKRFTPSLSPCVIPSYGHIEFSLLWKEICAI